MSDYHLVEKHGRIMEFGDLCVLTIDPRRLQGLTWRLVEFQPSPDLDAKPELYLTAFEATMRFPINANSPVLDMQLTMTRGEDEARQQAMQSRIVAPS